MRSALWCKAASVHAVDDADGRACHRRADRLDRRCEPTIEADHHERRLTRGAQRVHDVGDALQFGLGDAQRLLHEHGLARFERVDGELGVAVVPRGDDDGMQSQSRQIVSDAVEQASKPNFSLRSRESHSGHDHA